VSKRAKPKCVWVCALFGTCGTIQEIAFVHADVIKKNRGNTSPASHHSKDSVRGDVQDYHAPNNPPRGGNGGDGGNDGKREESIQRPGVSADSRGGSVLRGLAAHGGARGTTGADEGVGSETGAEGEVGG
jgi:hypothetical protein